MPLGISHRVGTERLHLPSAGQLGTAILPLDPLVVRTQDALEDAQYQRPSSMWERGDDRTIGDHQGVCMEIDGALGSCTLQDVELPVDDPPSQPPVCMGREGHPRHRPVVRDRQRRTGGDDVVRQFHVLTRGREHADVVTALDEHLGKLHDMRLDAAGDVEAVRADHPDSHWSASSRAMALHSSPPPTAVAACASRRGVRRCSARTPRPVPGSRRPRHRSRRSVRRRRRSNKAPRRTSGGPG